MLYRESAGAVVDFAVFCVMDFGHLNLDCKLKTENKIIIILYWAECDVQRSMDGGAESASAGLLQSLSCVALAFL